MCPLQTRKEIDFAGAVNKSDIKRTALIVHRAQLRVYFVAVATFSLAAGRQKCNQFFPLGRRALLFLSSALYDTLVKRAFGAGSDPKFADPCRRAQPAAIFSLSSHTTLQQDKIGLCVWVCARCKC
jgi:hypothetical protein